MSELEHFLAQWRQPSPTITVTTSGSTGTPKTIHVYKERMRASARATCQTLHLHEGQRALLCLSTRYIAGMMMVVRALECGMQLVEAPVSQHPLSIDIGEIHFAAMVPAQVWASLNVERERERLSHIGCLIIGGGSIDEALERELSSFPNAIYSTYGMTETLSHVALRRVSGSDASPWYRPLPGVTISAGADNCLVIDAPHVCEGRLHTHDIVCFHPDGIRFQILGRSDNVICSGGVKIQTEEAERLLRPHISLRLVCRNRLTTSRCLKLVLACCPCIGRLAQWSGCPDCHLLLPVNPTGQLLRSWLRTSKNTVLNMKSVEYMRHFYLKSVAYKQHFLEIVLRI